MKRALINLHIAVFLAGFTGVLGKLISLNEYLLVWYRLLITVISLVVLLLLQGSLPKLSIKRVVLIICTGGIIALHWVSFYGSVKYANVSIALVCFSTLGFFSALMEPLFSKKKWSGTELLLGMVAILGVYLIFHFDARYKTGIIFGIISAILAALFTLLNKKLLASLPLSTVTLYELMGGFVVLSILMPAYFGAFGLHWALPEGLDWFWLIILSWLCTIWAFYLSLGALKTLSPFTVNLSYNLEPVYGILLAFVVYQENRQLDNSFYFGLLLITIAVALQMMRAVRSRDF